MVLHFVLLLLLIPCHFTVAVVVVGDVVVTDVFVVVVVTVTDGVAAALGMV